MPYIVIVAVDENNRISKYQPCKSEAEAQAHIAKVDKLGYPNAFYVEEPGVDVQWVIPDVATKTISVDKAGMAQDKIDRAAQQIEAERKQEEFRNSINYQQRYVAFLDILGWSEAIEKSQNDPEFLKDLGVSLKIFDVLQSQAKWMQEHLQELASSQRWDTSPDHARITHFSDCVVLSDSPDSRGMHSLLMNVSSICSHFLTRGFFVRGGIVLGELFHNENSVFGPALIEAYRLESQEAKYPRVILEKRLAEAWGQGQEYHGQDGVHLGYVKTWRKSDDGWSFFDYLQSYNALAPFPSPENLIQKTIGNIRSMVINDLKKYSGEPSIWSKYEWFANYINEILDEYPQIKLPKIEIKFWQYSLGFNVWYALRALHRHWRKIMSVLGHK
ncbi:MAG: hypothetical protein HQ512_10405 [Rhodospirillales bacterium]|nr:hypothetical protein [Rhodospirillales bacterium]